jgi:hypothetical protein
MNRQKCQAAAAPGKGAGPPDPAPRWHFRSGSKRQMNRFISSYYQETNEDPFYA